MLIPGLTHLAEVELKAVGHEQVSLPGGQFKLLRIENVTRMGPGQELRVLWTDPEGEVLKSWTDTLNLETYRVPKDVALAEIEPGELDLGFDLAVKLTRAIPNPHTTVQARYRLTLEDGDPAELLPQGASQRVEAKGPHTAEVTVYALRPGTAGNPDAADETPAEADLRPSNMIQSDNAEIVRLTREAVGDEKDPWRKAVVLERFVGTYVKQKDYSQAFATAAEVARQARGRLHGTRRSAGGHAAPRTSLPVWPPGSYTCRAGVRSISTCGPRRTSTAVSFRWTPRYPVVALERPI